MGGGRGQDVGREVGGVWGWGGVFGGGCETESEECGRRGGWTGEGRRREREGEVDASPYGEEADGALLQQRSFRGGSERAGDREGGREVEGEVEIRTRTTLMCAALRIQLGRWRGNREIG